MSIGFDKGPRGPDADPAVRDTRRTSHLRLTAGSFLAAIGIAAIVYGGVIAATGPGDGSHPHELVGFAVCIAGLAVTVLGLWLAGADMT